MELHGRAVDQIPDGCGFHELLLQLGPVFIQVARLQADVEFGLMLFAAYPARKLRNSFQGKKIQAEGDKKWEQ